MQDNLDQSYYTILCKIEGLLIGYLPPITRSIACSKCFISTIGDENLAAINAASLQTFATSAPKNWQKNI